MNITAPVGVYVGHPGQYQVRMANTGNKHYDGASHEASFDGYAVGDGCFEGVTTFYPAGPWVAPYRVCLQ